MVESYQWIKALHLISVIAWMAGMLYLPRLFVYHCDAAPGSDKSETFKVMERRLLRGIMGPAMILTWVFGLWLLYISEAWKEPWMMVKLVLVAAMTVMHHALALWRKDFEADRNRRPARFYRIANEIPTVLLIAIVVLVIVQPF
jgi:putative membrane protein